MNRLEKVLTTINKNIEKKEDILFRNYKSKSLPDIWFGVIRTSPAKYSNGWRRLFIALQNLLKISYQNQNTFNTYVSKFRNSIREIHGQGEIYKQSLYILGRSKEEADIQKRETAERVEMRNLGRFRRPYVKLSELFEKIEELKNGNKYEKILAVMLATCSRAIEVVGLSTFLSNKNKNKIIVRGIAKSSVVEVERDLVYLESSDVLKLVEDIRSGTTRNINPNLNKAFFKQILPLFHTAGANPTKDEIIYLASLTAHKCRYISANASYLLYGRPNNIPEETYIQRQLGHVSPASTKFYLCINLL
jgi:integrase